MVELVKIADLTTAQIASICDHTFLKLEEHFAEERSYEGKSPERRRFNAFVDFLDRTCEMIVPPYGVCVYPEDVELVKDYLNEYGDGNIKISAVAGFPEGWRYSTGRKIEQAKTALDAGASEIDMVLDYNALKHGHFPHVYPDIEKVTKAVHEKQGLLKVIFENSAFHSNPKLIKKACEMCIEAGADFVKTSTGFGVYGARAEDVRIMRANFNGGVKIAGGVNKDNVYELLEAGSGRTDGCIDLDPMKIRIGESSLLGRLSDGY